MIIFLGREDDDKRMVKLDFWAYINKKNSSHSLFGAWSFLSVPIRYTPSEGPKGFVD